jgi:putative (di)nucleoside polyphosphate hydrolase
MFEIFLVESIIVVDKDGFRPNVGIIVSDGMGKLLWAKRIGQDAWQFPQGGIDAEESLETALYRELFEEVGLEAQDVDILACTKEWLRYRLPQSMQRKNSNPYFVGQKQKWFLLQLLSNEKKISLDQTPHPEFDKWAWVNYWYPVNQIVEFKRNVYRKVLKEFSPLQCNLEKKAESYPRAIG